MIHVPQTGKEAERLIKKGHVEYAHWPNGSFCYVARNQVNEVRYFDLSCPWLAKKFAKSRSHAY